MYDPTVGRWLNLDPIGFAGTDANTARYVANRPTSATDPTGLVDVTARIGAALKSMVLPNILKYASETESLRRDEKIGFRYSAQNDGSYHPTKMRAAEIKALFDGKAPGMKRYICTEMQTLIWARAVIEAIGEEGFDAICTSLADFRRKYVVEENSFSIDRLQVGDGARLFCPYSGAGNADSEYVIMLEAGGTEYNPLAGTNRATTQTLFYGWSGDDDLFQTYGGWRATLKAAGTGASRETTDETHRLNYDAIAKDFDMWNRVTQCLP